jgi:hypothetical protein
LAQRREAVGDSSCGGDDEREKNNKINKATKTSDGRALVEQAKPLAIAQGVELITREQRLGQLACSQSALQAFLLPMRAW